jgi:hypothetical protein
MRKIGVLFTLLLIVVLAFIQSKVVQADFGTNWTATMFPSTNLTGTGVPVAGINAINFNWGNNSPIINGVSITNCPSSPTCVDNFSIRFTSSQSFTAGKYQFVVAADDTVRVLIDGAIVLDKFSPTSGRPLTTDTFIITLTSGTHNITVEYNEFIDQAAIQVQWFKTTAVATATPSAPTRNYYATQNVPLTWSQVSWSIGYEVQVSKIKTFTEFAYFDDTLPPELLSVITTPLTENGTYYWRVRAKKPNDEWGMWSAINSFEVDVP